MNKTYSQENLKRILDIDSPSIFVLADNSIYIGTLRSDYGLRPGHGTHYRIVPPNINTSGIRVSKSFIKKIILFNGLVYPKDPDGPHVMLDILQLNELVNRAGYYFY